MEINYEVKKEVESENPHGKGCYTNCYEHSDCGSDYGCK